jgi:type VI secretion system protein ImpF
MARGTPQKVVRPSFYDRLTGQVPKNVPGPQLVADVRALKRAVARDLERLLNTVAWLPWDLERSDELANCILTFGLPDLSTYSWISPKAQNSICTALEQAIRVHEPRLVPRTVRVELLERHDVADFRIRFRIEGLMKIEPVIERVAYDSHIDFDSGAVHIERAL